MYIVFSLIIIIILGYGGICLYLYTYQRTILYHPDKYMKHPHDYGLEQFQEISLETADKLKITAWYYPAPDPTTPTLLYYHGNGGNLGDRIEKLLYFTTTGLGVLALSYRGYGKSEGTPSEKGLYIDGRTAIDWLLHRHISIENIILYGESLGTGVATQLATEYSVKAVILEAPYTSIENRARELYPYIPVKFLLKDKFNTLKKIPYIHTPLMILHGMKDEVMPVDHSKKILQAAQYPKKAYFFPHVGHTDFDLEKLANYVRNFIENLPANTGDSADAHKDN